MKSVAVGSGIERRQALDALLASETFRRADQLKRLLGYLFEQEELGRTHEVTEYELGTKALGRPESFSPEADSTVRTRMHGLRQKLEEFYRSSSGGEGLRIEIPKGSYRVQFHAGAVVRESGFRQRLSIAGVVLAVGLGSVLCWRVWAATPLDLLWRPMVNSAQPAVLLVGQPAHIWVRDVRGQAVPLDYAHFPDPVPNSKAFLDFIGPRLAANAQPVLHPSPNATLWGDAAGAAAAARFLAFRQAQSEFMPESGLKSEVALRGRPVLAFGRPEYSPAIQRYLLVTGGYTVGMLNEIRHYSIYRPSDPKDRYLNTQPPNEVNHGLVTVLSDGPSRVFVFSGITSDGSAAGLDYLTNKEAVGQLWGLMEKQGLKQWPSVFQVVLRVDSSAGYAMAAQYERHLVLKP